MSDRLALITGGSSGMGLEYARQLASRSFDLLLVSIQNQDLASENAADDLFSFCKESDLLPDILVCNAGMFFFKELSTSSPIPNWQFCSVKK